MSETSTKRQCLIVVLQEELTLAYYLPWPMSSFRVGDATFNDVGLGEWTGFYDWMRRANGNLVGVRYWPSEENQPLFDAARTLHYARITSTLGLEIYFSNEEMADEQSCDQEFQYDAVFRSVSGAWAFAFDVTALTPTDHQRLREICGRWAEVTAVDHS